MGKKPDSTPSAMLSGFLNKAKQNDCARLAESEDEAGHRHLQVRLTKRDAKRFRCLSDLRDMSIQDALVSAVNAMMAEWNEPPVANPGARGKRMDQ
jgi:hypothetical protein